MSRYKSLGYCRFKHPIGNQAIVEGLVIEYISLELLVIHTNSKDRVWFHISKYYIPDGSLIDTTYANVRVCELHKGLAKHFYENMEVIEPPSNSTAEENFAPPPF